MMHMVLSVLVAVSQQPTTYNVYIRPRYESFGYAGTMTLFFVGGGIVNGTYRDANTAIAQTVEGSVKGNRISLDLPTLGRLHLNGTVEPNGDIDGFASSFSAGDSTLYVVRASREIASKS